MTFNTIDFAKRQKMHMNMQSFTYYTVRLEVSLPSAVYSKLRGLSTRLGLTHSDTIARLVEQAYAASEAAIPLSLPLAVVAPGYEPLIPGSDKPVLKDGSGRCIARFSEMKDAKAVAAVVNAAGKQS